MNKYENIKFMDIKYYDDAVNKFVEDVVADEDIGEFESVAFIGDMENICWALDELVREDATPSINQVLLPDDMPDETYIIYVSADYEMYVCPLRSFKHIDSIQRAYVDTWRKDVQPTIDALLDNNCEVILVTVVDMVEYSDYKTGNGEKSAKTDKALAETRRETSAKTQKSTYTYKVNDKYVTKEEYQKALDKIEKISLPTEDIEYVHKVLLKDFCQTMDIFNTRLRKLLLL